MLNPNQTAGVSTISPIFRASPGPGFRNSPFLNPVCNLDKCFIYSVRPQFLSNGVWVFGESATVRNAAGVLDAAYGLRSTVEGDFIKNALRRRRRYLARYLEHASRQSGPP